MVAYKLADRGKAPWRMAVTLAAVTAGASLVTWMEVPTPKCACSAGWVHVKVAASKVTAAEARAQFVVSQGFLHASTDGGIAPMFEELEPDVRDDRARWIRVLTDDPERLVEALSGDPAIEQAFIEPEVTLPNEVGPLIDTHKLSLIDLDHPLHREDPSCPISTPSFESYQGYLGPAPHGIDAPAAWRRGGRGQGIWFADVEGGWNAKHEDLPGDRITHVVGREINDGWRAHGTAVLGEVVGRDNGKGVVGIAPDGSPHCPVRSSRCNTILPCAPARLHRPPDRPACHSVVSRLTARRICATSDSDRSSNEPGPASSGASSTGRYCAAPATSAPTLDSRATTSVAEHW